jgi:hypothetical protein
VAIEISPKNTVFKRPADLFLFAPALPAHNSFSKDIVVSCPVHKQRQNGRVVKVEPRLVFGTPESLTAALKRSKYSRAVNTAFVEPHNGTDRNRNVRKMRQTYCFSKYWQMRVAVTYFTMYSYNFYWPVRMLQRRGRSRTPAMAAGLADHVWSIQEWITLPAIQSGQAARQISSFQFSSSGFDINAINDITKTAYPSYPDAPS